jgi:hypothetical protein
MPSRVPILAAVLLFVNGCDYSQKKPETAPVVLAAWNLAPAFAAQGQRKTGYNVSRQRITF